MLDFAACSLRPISESDLDLLLAWRNAEAIRRNMFTDHLITVVEHQAWFKKTQAGDSSHHLLFTYAHHPLGLVNITGIDRINGKCYWGFYIGEPEAPRGSGAAMACLAIDHTFRDLKIRKLCSEVFAFNTASLSYHRKLGFKKEGRLRAHIIKAGKYEDVICFGLLRPEWEEARTRVWRSVFERSDERV